MPCARYTSISTRRPLRLISLRYEFREQLVRLGVLSDMTDSLDRRERARGFDGAFCPEPKR